MGPLSGDDFMLLLQFVPILFYIFWVKYFILYYLQFVPILF